MRILSVAWAIYDSQIDIFCGNCTGAGLVIKNLCEYIGKTEESYLYVGQYDIPNVKIGNINLVSNILNDDIYMNCSRTEKLCIQFEKVLNKLKPDVVNIHGIGEMAIKCIYICKKNKIPCFFVEHLYIGLNKNFKGYDRDIIWEKEIYNMHDLKIVTVSTGMKKKILNDYGNLNPANLVVIKNGTDFRAVIIKSKLREKYSLVNKKVLLCVGNITHRKNQIQLIDAYKLLPKYIQENISIIFCGIDRMNGEFQRKIKYENLQDKLIYIGAVSSDEIKKFYSIGDGLIMPSLAEGLSIAALEAITYGLPIIMNSESECYDDLCDEKICVFYENKKNEDMALAIKKWFEKDWNDNYIRLYSKNFSIEKMAKEYIELNKNMMLVN